MRYIIREIEIIFYGPSSYYIEDVESTPAVKEIKHRIIAEFNSRKHIDVDELVNIDGEFYVVDQHILVTDSDGKHIELYVSRYEEGMPHGRMVYWPERDKKEIWNGRKRKWNMK